MTNVDFGKLDVANIRIFAHDLDMYLVDYPDKAYPAKFSKYTGLRAKATAQKLVDEGSADPKLQVLANMSDSDVFHFSVKSYADHGSTTTGHQLEFGIDGTALYVDHHVDVVEHEVKNNFNGRVLPDEKLRQAMLGIKDIGNKHYLFTNGTQFYAESITEDQNLSDVFEKQVGADSFGEKNLTFKAQKIAFLNFLAHTKIPSITGYIIGETDRVMTEKDRQWPHVCFGDDAPSALVSAKWFGFQTVWKKTERGIITAKERQFVDHTISNVPNFLGQVELQQRHLIQHAFPHVKLPSPRLLATS